MTRRSRIAVVTLAVWTAYVWITRIANAWGDPALSVGAKWVTTVVSLSLVGSAIGSVWAVWTVQARRLVDVFLVVTVAVWAIRVPQILLADHDVAFKVVHVVLGVVSVALAAVTWWAIRSGSLWASPSPSSRSRAPHPV